jgi:hypothetical protein
LEALVIVDRKSRIQMFSSVPIIISNGFHRCTTLTEGLFASDCQVKTIDGFAEGISLSPIDIPSLVEIIDWNSFLRCTCLMEVVFASDCHVK